MDVPARDRARINRPEVDLAEALEVLGVGPRMCLTEPRSSTIRSSGNTSYQAGCWTASRS